jgi:hypothetical protein
MGKTSSSLPFRRSARVNLGCSVRLTGTLPSRAPFDVEARIVTISKYGAKIKTGVPLTVGMPVKIQPLQGEKSGFFRVVWVGREGTPRAGEVGVEFAHEVGSILGINFPDLTAPLK